MGGDTRDHPLESLLREKVPADTVPLPWLDVAFPTPGSTGTMHPTSLVYALSMAGLVGATAWIIDGAASRSGSWSRPKRLVVRWLMTGLTLATGLWTYFADASLRGTTLFEVSGPWEKNAGRTWAVVIEHPGVEHTLMVSPFVRGLASAEGPLTTRTRLVDGDGTALVDRTFVHEVVPKSGRSAGGDTWAAAAFHFTPATTGPHELSVQALEGVLPPLLHLRLSDPEKRDGKRAAGY